MLDKNIMNNLANKKFGRLIVIELEGRNKWGNLRYLCGCDCGNTKIVLGKHLISGATKSCGCFRKEQIKKKLTKHGKCSIGRSSKIYRAWTSMTQRCTNPSNGGYIDYGARGIKVCDRWSVFENFLTDMGEVPEGCQLDRINNNLGYCKSNCRWATRKQQARNRRTTNLITHNGITQCASDWAKELNITLTALIYRLRNPSWSREKALTLRKK